METVLYAALKEISIGNNPGTRLSSEDMVLIAKVACGLYEASQHRVHTDPPSACPACGTLPEEAEHDPTCPLASAGG